MLKSVFQKFVKYTVMPVRKCVPKWLHVHKISRTTTTALFSAAVTYQWHYGNSLIFIYQI